MAERVALSFDDGPSPWTTAVLDTLAAHGARATFFLVGASLEAREDVVRRIHADGHEIGNHTWSHPSLTRECDEERVRSELLRTSDALEGILGVRPGLYRAPRYERDDRVDAVAALLGLRHARGDVIPPDWHPRASPRLIAAMAVQGARAGAIIGLHDGVPPQEAAEEVTRQPTVEALALILPRLAERGLTCVPVSELPA